MTKPLLLVVALGACTTSQTPTSLSQLGKAQIAVVSKGDLTIEFHVDTSDRTVDSCPLLGDDVTASFDGQPMFVARGGYDTDSTGCYPIGFWFAPQPDAALQTFEQTTSSSALMISDKTATWHIDGHPLLSNNFVDDAANARIIWQDVSTISTAEVAPAVQIQIVGNEIHYPAGTQISWVSAYAHPVATRCDGPAVCTVDLSGERQLRPINP